VLTGNLLTEERVSTSLDRRKPRSTDVADVGDASSGATVADGRAGMLHA
jgi:hypothetical protein